jgi:patatin-like phospholipase/acyl hydrolase
LEKALNDSKLIPTNYSIMDALVPTFITAWAINDRTPRFFSQFSFTNWREPKFNHEMSLNDMVLASAATPYYFKPAMVTGHKSPFISGDNVAQSPALYAMLNDIQNLDVDKKDIRIVSIGAINEESSAISKNTGLVNWAVRLASLNAPVKRHTMDYFANQVLREQSHTFHKFEIQMTVANSEALYYTSKRMPLLEQYA